MHSKQLEENFRRYIHVYALLKHFTPRETDNQCRVVQQPDLARTLIEQGSRSQAGKWRSYVQGKGIGADRPSRTDAA